MTGMLGGILCALLSQAFQAHNWGIYEAPSNWTGFNTRNGASRDQAGDILTVGKLDGNTIGPMANWTVNEVAGYWTFLRTARYDYGKMYVENPSSCVRTIDVCTVWSRNLVLSVYLGFPSWVPSWTCIETQAKCVAGTVTQAIALPGEVLADQILNDDPFLTKIVDQNGQKLYEDAISSLATAIGGNANSAYKYKADILDQQLAAELDSAVAAITARVQNNNNNTVLVEVANEPNLFPYIPPELYAKYYANWVNAIASDPRIIALHGRYTFDLKFMPGGLADASSMPEPVRDLLSTGVFLHWLNWDLGFQQITDDNQYYDAFVSALTTYELGKFGNSGGAASVINYGNVHLYPMTQYGQSEQSMIDGYKSKLDKLALNSISKQIIVSEFGNINAVNPPDIVSGVMKPLIHMLNGRTDIAQAYWFIGGGSDPKFPSTHWIPTFDPVLKAEAFTAGFLSLELAQSVLAPLGATISGEYQILAATGFAMDYHNQLNAIGRSAPYQGLAQADGTPTSLGYAYKQLTGRGFNPAIQLLLSD